jgi:hypothetical protein
MTPEQRLQRMDELREANAAAHDRLTRQEREREQDPCAMQDHLLAADVRSTFDPNGLMFTAPVSGEDTAEPAGGPYSRKTDPRRGMVFMTREDATLPAPEPAPMASNGDALYGRDGVLTRQLGMLVAEMRRERSRDLAERDRRISEPEGELREVKAMLADTLQRYDKSSKAVATLSAEIVSEHRDRQALFDALDRQFAELRAYTRGALRDFWSTT